MGNDPVDCGGDHETKAESSPATTATSIGAAAGIAGAGWLVPGWDGTVFGGEGGGVAAGKTSAEKTVVTDGADEKLAPNNVEGPIVMMHVAFDPAQAPLQPSKFAPEAGTAVRVTVCPVANP